MRHIERFGLAIFLLALTTATAFPQEAYSTRSPKPLCAEGWHGDELAGHAAEPNRPREETTFTTNTVIYAESGDFVNVKSIKTYFRKTLCTNACFDIHIKLSPLRSPRAGEPPGFKANATYFNKCPKSRTDPAGLFPEDHDPSRGCYIRNRQQPLVKISIFEEDGRTLKKEIGPKSRCDSLFKAELKNILVSETKGKGRIDLESLENKLKKLGEETRNALETPRSDNAQKQLLNALMETGVRKKPSKISSTKS